jgi:membrane associated rhomboid family serine protease
MVLPVYDVQPTRRVPAITYSLVAINVAVFLATPLASVVAWHGGEVSAECAANTFLAEYAAIPRELTTGTQLPLDNPLTEDCQVDPYTKVPWLSALFAMFLHGDGTHLLGNMITLFVIGPGLEDRLGRMRYLIFYLVAGYVATYGYALSYADVITPLVGASGAIAGVFGAYLVINPQGRVWSLVLPFIPMRLPVWVVLGYWIIFDNVLVQGSRAASGVAVVAHIIGFFAGMTWGFAERRGFRQRSALLGRVH